MIYAKSYALCELKDFSPISPVKPESRATLSAKTESESLFDGRTGTGTDLTPFSLEPNDEFGIPVLEMSSDSDVSKIHLKKLSKIIYYKYLCSLNIWIRIL